MTEIANCPFCGVTPVKATGILAPRYQIAFVHPQNGCVIEAHDIHDSEIAAWNKRAQPAGEADERAEWKAFSQWAWEKDGDPVGRMEGREAVWSGWIARARLAAPPAVANQAGLTDAQINAIYQDQVKGRMAGDGLPFHNRYARAIERALRAAPHTESHALGGDGE